MRNTCLGSAGLDTPGQSQNRYITYDLEVSLLRTELRAAGVTCKPTMNRPFCSLSGCALDFSLASFKATCNTNYTQYKTNFFETGKFSGSIFSPVYYTPEERAKKESVENQTKAEIEKTIIGLMDIMPCTETASLFRQAMINIRGKTKQKYIDLYYEVANSLSEQLAETDVGTLEAPEPERDEVVEN